MLPGFSPIFCRSNSADVLTQKLINIFGTDIVGLYLGEDLVTDSLNNVISWPGRIGGSCRNTASGYFTRVTSNNNKKICLSVGTGTQCLQFVDTNKARSMWVIVNNLTLPFVNGTYPAAIKTNSASTEDSGVTGNSNTSTIRNLAGTAYVNGIATNVVMSGSNLVICEGTNVNNQTDIGVGTRIGSFYANGTWPFPGNIFFGMNLIVVPTTEQRVKALAAIGEYYGYTPDEILTMQMKAIFGTTLEGLWIGSDIIVDGSNLITSWPGRVGNTLTNATAQRFTVGTINGRHSMAPGSIAEAKMLSCNGVTNIYSHIVVATMQTAISAYEQLTTSYATTTGDIIRNALTTGIYTATGFSHYVNGVASETFPSSGIAIVESNGTTTLQPGTGVGGWNGGNRVWPGNIGLVAALTANPTIEQRSLYMQVLKNYYGI